MFQRQVRFQVDVSTITKQAGDSPKEYLYAITFTLLSGKIMATVSKLLQCLHLQFWKDISSNLEDGSTVFV